MKQLPQNLKSLLQEIGESAVLLRVSVLIAAKKKGWRVYRSYTEDGCDIVARKVHGKSPPGYRKELRLEVKSRQNLVTERKGQQMHFLLSKAERDSCHFLVAFWFDRGEYFIVPKRDLKPATKAKVSYRFIANLLKSGEHNQESKKYLNRWDRLTSLIK